MKNKLMLALLVSAPVALRAMEPAPAANAAPAAPAANQPAAVVQAAPAAEDFFVHLKQLLNVDSEVAVANKLHSYIAGIEVVAQQDLIKALQMLGMQKKLAIVHLAVSEALPQQQTRDLVAASAAAAPTATSAAQAAISILQTAYTAASNPQNQQKVQELVQDAEKTGCFGLCKKKTTK